MHDALEKSIFYMAAVKGFMKAPDYFFIIERFTVSLHENVQTSNESQKREYPIITIIIYPVKGSS
jgi:hypothetical protein